MASPTPPATTPYRSTTSASPYPRIVFTRRSSTIQNVKKIALLSAMSADCIRKVARCAIAAATLVRRSAPQNLNISSSVELERARRAAEHDRCHRDPDREPEREQPYERRHLEERPAEHERRGSGEQGGE